MKLPNLEQAIVPEAKITKYLLSLTHPIGQGKAKFFLAYGFSPDNWQIMARALTNHATIHDVTKVEEAPFGVRYVIEGILQTPIGKTPFVRAVWFIDADDTIPRFISAYPQEARESE